MKRDEREREREIYKRQLTHFREFNEYAEHTYTHAHTPPWHFLAAKEMCAKFKDQIFMHLVRATEQKWGRESKGRGNIQQTRIKNAKHIKKRRNRNCESG